MAPVGTNPGNALFDERLQFARDLVCTRFQLELLSISPLGYKPNSFSPPNNYVFRLDVAERTTALRLASDDAQHGTVPLPANVSVLVLLIPSPSAPLALAQDVRVENKVAAMVLAREALSSLPSIRIARVFAWSRSIGAVPGWILEEYLSGASLAPSFYDMRNESGCIMLDQIVQVFNCFHEYSLPSSVTSFGCLRFDHDGHIVSNNTDNERGSFAYAFDGMPSLAALEADKIEVLRSQLEDTPPKLHNWKHAASRERFEHFLALCRTCVAQGISHPRRQLVHGDLCTENMLYDPESRLLSGIIDFDFAHVGTCQDANGILILASIILSSDDK